MTITGHWYFDIFMYDHNSRENCYYTSTVLYSSIFIIHAIMTNTWHCISCMAFMLESTCYYDQHFTLYLLYGYDHYLSVYYNQHLTLILLYSYYSRVSRLIWPTLDFIFLYCQHSIFYQLSWLAARTEYSK